MNPPVVTIFLLLATVALLGFTLVIAHCDRQERR